MSKSTFRLARTVFSVRRGFSGSDVIGFREDRSAWLDDRSTARDAFERTLNECGGYQSPDDFSFVVHQISYLPENRRLLAWDTDAQIRLLMLLNQDVLDEADFRSRRDELRLMDSRKRHIHVAVGKAAGQLASLLQYRGEDVSEQDTEESTSTVTAGALELAVERLKELNNQRRGLEEKARTANSNLSNISSEVEVLREKIDLTEASLVAHFLSEQERESVLPVYKLAELGICPVCGTNQPDLQAIAQEHYRAHRCILCGSEEPKAPNQEIVSLRSQLSARLQAQQALEESVRTLNAAIERIKREEDNQQAVVNEVNFSQPVVTLSDQRLPSSTREELESLHASLVRDEASLEEQILKRRTQLESDYKDFQSAVQVRMERLRKLYTDYATAFLGIECELSESRDLGLITLTRLVPKFSGIVRDVPSSCSEAQRFFLDIAFRLALIDFAAEYDGEPASFLCETPETALDMSYIENVVQMFISFSRKGHSLLLTANIQPNGIAAQLLQSTPLKGRAARVLNLLEIGQLSQVHQAHLAELNRVVRRTVG